MKLQSFLFLWLFGSIDCAARQHREIECQSDAECPEDYYCYEISNLCARCNKNFCSILNRRDSYRKCHKEHYECGQCLPGYEEEIFSDGTTRGACIISSRHTTEPHPISATMTNEQIDPTLKASPILYSVIGFLLSVVFVLVFLQVKRNRQLRADEIRRASTEEIPLTNRCAHKISEADEPRNPPPYFELPSAPPIQDSPNNSHIINNNINVGLHTVEATNIEPSPIVKKEPECASVPQHELCGITKMSLLQALPFRNPNYYEIEEQSSSGTLTPYHFENEYGLPESEEFPSIGDEDTQPSDWTPAPPAETVAPAPESSCSASGQNPLQETPDEKESRGKRPSTEPEQEDEQTPPKKVRSDSEEESSVESSHSSQRSFDGHFSQFRNKCNTE